MACLVFGGLCVVLDTCWLLLWFVEWLGLMFCLVVIDGLLLRCTGLVVDCDLDLLFLGCWFSCLG